MDAAALVPIHGFERAVSLRPKLRMDLLLCNASCFYTSTKLYY